MVVIHMAKKRSEKLELVMSDKVKKKIKYIMKKMKFSKENLFLRYCITKAYLPYATKTEKIAINKENRLILKYEAEHAKKK